MSQASAVTILNRVSAEVGIPVAADPFSSTDPNQALLVRLLNGSGRELVDVHPWPELDQVLQLDFATSAGSASFYTPDDLAYIHNQTIWNLDTAQPVKGPVTAQDWYLLKNSITASVSEMYFRRIGPALQFLPDPSPVSTVIELEYTSSYWVEDATGATKAAVTAADDTVLLDDHLVSRLLKVRWLESKGMSTAAAAIEFRSSLENAIGKARGGARVLTVTGRNYSNLIPPMLTPETGIGL